VSHTERQAMQQAVVDYGALQPDSPSQEKNFAPPRPRVCLTASLFHILAFSGCWHGKFFSPLMSRISNFRNIQQVRHRL